MEPTGARTSTRGIGAAVAGGLIGLAEDYLTERISRGIIFDLREQLSGTLVHQSVGSITVAHRHLRRRRRRRVTLRARSRRLLEHA
jgi:hypothetical protein